MFEKEIKFISDFTINKLKSEGSSFSVEKLEQSEIHPAIVKFIAAEIDLWIFEDRKKLLQDSKFDYSGSEISRLFSLINNEIRKTKKIQFEELARQIVRAVSFNVNFIVRPNWSLVKFIFEKSDTISVDEIEQKLGFIYYYEFLKDILTAYFRKRKIKNISRTELDLILKKIDRELISSSEEKIIRKSLEAMVDFFNIGAVNTSRVWPMYVEVFLKEKDLLDHLLKLHKAIPADKKQKMDTEEILQILYSTSQSVNTEKAESRQTNETELSESALEDSGDHPEENIISEEQIHRSEETNERGTVASDSQQETESEQLEFEAESSSTEDEIQSDEELISIEEEDITDPNITVSDELNNAGDEFEFSESNMIDENQPGKSKPNPDELLGFLTQKETDRIIETVFNDDHDDFVMTIEKITECSSYKEASEILKGVFFTYKINPYIREAVALTNAVAKFFDQE